MDVIHYKAREDKQIVAKSAYVALGVNMDFEPDFY
jgi:putative transposase